MYGLPKWSPIHYIHIYIYLPNMSKFLFSEITESLVGLLFGHRHPKVHRISFLVLFVDIVNFNFQGNGIDKIHWIQKIRRPMFQTAGS